MTVIELPNHGHIKLIVLAGLDYACRVKAAFPNMRPNLIEAMVPVTFVD